MVDIQTLLRNNIRNIVPYSSARDEFTGSEGIFLDANENPYSNKYNRYPDPHQKLLKEKVAQIKQISTNEIFLGNGSDEAIDLIIRAFCNPGKDNVVIMPPTYGMYEVSAKINDVKVKKAPLTQDFKINTNTLLATIDSSTKLIFICTPNNPTGNSFDTFTIQKIIEKFKGIVVIDEAYIDFSNQEGFVHEIDEYPNLIVLQTLSKAWGLAGIRLGMAFANPAIIKVLDKIKPPYNVSQLTQETALKYIENGVVAKNQQVEKILSERNKLQEALSSLPYVKQVYPSNANFLLIKTENANEIYQELIKSKIIIRNRTKLELCEGCLRITIGTPEENQALITALKDIEL